MFSCKNKTFSEAWLLLKRLSDHKTQLNYLVLHCAEISFLVPYEIQIVAKEIKIKRPFSY